MLNQLLVLKPVQLFSAFSALCAPVYMLDLWSIARFIADSSHAGRTHHIVEVVSMPIFGIDVRCVGM